MLKRYIIILFITTLLGCEQSPNLASGQRGSVPLQKIAVAYTNQPQSVLVHIAVVEGYFVEEGLEIQSLMYTFGKESLQSLLEFRGHQEFRGHHTKFCSPC